MKPVQLVGLVLAGAVAVSAVTWMVAARVLQSPAEVAAASEPPEAGPVTVPVEEQVLESEVVVRGTLRFDEPIGVGLGGSPAVDGQRVVTWLPEPDDEIDEGEVVLQVSGRPLLALEGPIPAYRDLRPGMSGDDVAQLQDALRRLGHLDGGSDGEFDAATRQAVAALYEEAGHDPPGPSTEETETLRGAEQAVSAARTQLVQAEQRLDQAREGPSEVELLEAEQQVNEAREQVEATEDGTTERRRAEDQLALAEARLAELEADPDTSAEEAEVAAARTELVEASDRLAEAEAAAGTWLPAGEVVYMPELPQRVDEVTTELGAEATGDLVTVSSAEIVIETSIPAEDVGLVSEGDAVFVGADGEEIDGIVAELADRPGTHDAADDRHHVRVDPADDAADLLGQSLRVRIPVESTDGEVLAVPLVAVSAGADGTSRVQVVDDSAEDHRVEIELVTVEPGLSTDGMVEISPVDGELVAGDLVVVGSDPDDADEVEGDA